jgi:hypothetical protein
MASLPDQYDRYARLREPAQAETPPKPGKCRRAATWLGEKVLREARA